MYPKTEAYMAELIKANKIPGISYAFYSDKARLVNQIGYQQLFPEKKALEAHTQYDMASLTKVICTTTIILKLIEAKKIEIDQSLHYYLPEFLDEDVTIRELLTHTSDINPFIPNRDSLNQVALKEAMLKLKSGDKRGEVVAYTDTGTVLLGFLIEEFYNRPVQEVFQDEILIPLDMLESTFFEVNLEKVAPTELTQKRGLIKGQVHDPKAFVLGKHCGSAGLFATVEDTLKFVEMLFNRGLVDDQTFLREETVMSLLKDYTKGNSKPRSLGWDLIEYENRVLLYHTGYTGTFMIIDVLKREAFVFLSNRVHPNDNRDEYLQLRDELIQIYLKERQEREKML